MQNAPREHSAILSTFIKLPFVCKAFGLSSSEWPLKTGFTVIGSSTSIAFKCHWTFSMVCLFLAVQSVGLQCVIVAFTGYLILLRPIIEL